MTATQWLGLCAAMVIPVGLIGILIWVETHEWFEDLFDKIKIKHEERKWKRWYKKESKKGKK